MTYNERPTILLNLNAAATTATMVKTSLIATTALAAICNTAIIVEAFSTTSCQSSSSPRINALSSSVTNKCASTMSINSSTRLNMQLSSRRNNSNTKKSLATLFPIKASSQQLVTTVTHLIQRLRKSITIVLAALTILFSTTSSSSSRLVPHAHAASSSAVVTSSSVVTKSSSWVQSLNPFYTKSANELIDNYVRDRLFADDEYDPVESAYREAYADSSSLTSSESTGAYPTLLAETASTALGRKQDISTLLSSSKTVGGTSSTSGGMDAAKKDGITAILIKSSDFLQRRLKVSASVSYYIIAASSILSLCVLPGTIGVLYQGFQRLQIDKSEMKMYGKISDMDATRKRITNDDDDDDDDDDE
mmetsp:Transcript_15018/g.24598  ORF Transcript_15018/g.24598 Transcript_15018/m.24598 type:complete len:363 (+) Transcript_15018:19-1107(+)